MGDTGSLIVGFVASILVIKFNEANIVSSISYSISSAPAVSIGIIIIPLFDTLRVFSLRVAKGGSPFKPDKNHLHHRMLALGFSHLTSTAILAGFNVCIVFTSFLLSDWGILPLVGVISALCIAFIMIIENSIRNQKRKKQTTVDMPVISHTTTRASSAYWAMKM